MNKTKITLCGDDCLKCPRYNAKTEEELLKVAELWYRCGWRKEILLPQELKCTGCFAGKECSFGIAPCVAEHKISSCKECYEFPCAKIKSALESTSKSKHHCKKVCTPEEYKIIEEAFFNKEKNLGI